MRVFESYSEPDNSLREFRSTEELIGTYPIGTDPIGDGMAALLQLWSPSVMDQLTIERFALNPAACDGHTFRHRIKGSGLMQLYLGGICERALTKSHFGHQTQVRAQAWDMDRGVNWESLKKVSNKIQYHIRRRLAVGKVPGRPVLAQAMTLAKTGYALKDTLQTPWQYDLAPPNGPA